MAQISTKLSQLSPQRIQGHTQSRVPQYVVLRSLLYAAHPKSHNLHTPCIDKQLTFDSTMFSGLISRCRMSRACRQRTASHTSASLVAAYSQVNLRATLTSRKSEPSSMYSIMIKTLSLSLKQPQTLTMLGWLRKRLIFTSCTNWSSISLTDSLATCLMASRKPVLLCTAGNTFPNLPSPLHAPKLKSYIFKSAGRVLVDFLMRVREVKLPSGSVLLMLLSLITVPEVSSLQLALGVLVLIGVLEAGGGSIRVGQKTKFYVLLLFLLCCFEANFDFKSFLPPSEQSGSFFLRQSTGVRGALVKERGVGATRYCHEVALETVCLSFAISSILRVLASLLSALVFRMRCDRSVQVSRMGLVGRGLSWAGSCLGDVSMKECSLRSRYLVGVVLIDLELGFVWAWGSWQALLRGVSAPSHWFSFWAMRERPRMLALKELKGGGFEDAGFSRGAGYGLESSFSWKMGLPLLEYLIIFLLLIQFNPAPSTPVGGHPLPLPSPTLPSQLMDD